MWNLNPVATETLAPVRLFSKGPARNFLGPWLWRRHMIKRERESRLLWLVPLTRTPSASSRPHLHTNIFKLARGGFFYDFNPEVHTEENLVRAPAS